MNSATVIILTFYSINAFSLAFDLLYFEAIIVWACHIKESGGMHINICTCNDVA